MAYGTKEKGANLAIVFGSSKKSPKSSPGASEMEESGEDEDGEDEEMLKRYCEAMGVSTDEFKDAVRIAMK